MKRCLCLTLALVPFFAWGAEKAPAPAPAGRIYKTVQPVTVDGRLDEACWRRAEAIPVHFILGKTGEPAKELPMTVRYAWDDYYLYIGYEVFDVNLVTQGTGKMQGPDDNRREGCELGRGDELYDLTEFFISFGDRHFFWELHHDASNHFNDVWINSFEPDWPANQGVRWGIYFASEEFVRDDADKRVAMTVAMKPGADGRPSTVNDASDRDTGYTAEIRLPWGGIGAPMALKSESHIPFVQFDPVWKMAGREIWLMAVVQMNDGHFRYCHSSPTAPGGWFHKLVDYWPRYTLVEGAD